MIYVDGTLVFRKGEIDVGPLDHIIGVFGFAIAATANAIVEYNDDSMKFIKNRYAIEDTEWSNISKAISLNECAYKKKLL